MWFAILAGKTLALLTALYSRSEALTVILTASRLLASALAFRNESRHSFECSGVAVIGHLLRLVDVKVMAGGVTAASAFAALIANTSLSEALTVHFQAVDLGALAPRCLLLPWRQV